MDILLFGILPLMIPLLIIGCIIAFIFYVSRSSGFKTNKQSYTETSSSAEDELGHITYSLRTLEGAISEGLIGKDAGDQLKQRFIDRQRELSQEASESQPKFIAEDFTYSYQQAKEPLPRQSLTLAQMTRWLLYVGIFLLFIATAIFAVYKWQSFPDFVKFIILLGVTASFYLGGWYIKEMVNIQRGGIALAIVGAIMTFFDAYILLDAMDSLSNYLYWTMSVLICSLIYISVALWFKHAFFIYASGTTQALAVVLFGKYCKELTGAHITYSLLTHSVLTALIALSCVWFILEALATRKNLSHDLFIEPLQYLAQVLAAITILCQVPAFMDSFINHRSLSIFVVAIAYHVLLIMFYAFNYQYRKHTGFLYPCFLAQVSVVGYTLIFFEVPWTYFILVFTALALLWVLMSWIIDSQKLAALIFIQRPLFLSAMLLSGFISEAAVLKFIDLAGKADRTLPSTVDVLSFALLTIFFLLAAVHKRKGIFVYPFLLFLVLSVHVMGFRVGTELKFMGIPMSLISILFLISGYLLENYDFEDLEHAALNGFFLLSVYAVILSFVYQPALISVLLINACAYLILALTSQYRQFCTWMGLAQIAMALFAALDFYDISYLLANVTYISLYLAAFSVSLALKDANSENIKEIAKDVFNFSVVFCLVQLLIQIFGTLSYNISSAWIFDPAAGENILMLAFIVAGFFYVTASNHYDSGNLIFLGFFCFLAAYIVKLIYLEVSFIEWYSIPIGIYMISMGYLYRNRNPRSHINTFSNLIGMLIILGSSTFAFMLIYESPESQLHALFSALCAIMFLVAGAMIRTKVFFFGGILFLVWNALYQSWDFLYALPKWSTIGTLGLISIIAAVYLEQNREKFLDFSRNVRNTFAQDWD